MDHLGLRPRVRACVGGVPGRRPWSGGVRLPDPGPAALHQRPFEPDPAHRVPPAGWHRAAGRRGLHQPFGAAKPRVGLGGLRRRPGGHAAVRPARRRPVHGPRPRRVDHRHQPRIFRSARVPRLHRSHRAAAEPGAGTRPRRLRDPAPVAAPLHPGPRRPVRPDGDHRRLRRPVVRGAHPRRLLPIGVPDHDDRRHRSRADLLRPVPHALALAVERLVVDGYNIIHAWPALKRLLRDASLEAARDRLVERLSVFGMVAGADVTVVFDSNQAGANSEEMVEGVRVRFTRKGHSADHAIERIAYEASNTGDVITVATSDRFQGDLVRGMGGAVISALELERRVLDAEAELTRRVQRYQ
ncbi:hypothetical protein EPN29_08790 [bacterium]|nr:MAG: hypothetical protein EPN29_08790 [bacterium]